MHVPAMSDLRTTRLDGGVSIERGRLANTFHGALRDSQMSDGISPASIFVYN
jgi:hypothetical protein